MAPKCLPLELLYEFVPFIPAENATPNALSSCWLLHKLLQPRVVKWKKTMSDFIDFKKEIREIVSGITKNNSDFQNEIRSMVSGITQNNSDFQNEIRESNFEFQNEIRSMVSSITQNNSDFQKEIRESNFEFQNEIRSMVSGINKKLDICSEKIDICNTRIDICNAKIGDLQLEIDVLKLDVAKLKSEKAFPITDPSTSSVELAAKKVENPPEKHLHKTKSKTVPLTCGMRQLDETDKSVPNERKLEADKEDKASTPAVVPEAKDVENQPKKHLPETETKAAKSCEETIVSLRKHLNEFGRVANGVFVILENLAKEKGKEYAKKVQDMRKDSSNIVELEIKPDDADSIRRGLNFLNMRLKEFGRDKLDQLEKESDELTEEANSQIEHLRKNFSALKIAFDNAMQKYPHASCSDSPVLVGRVDQLQVRATAITKNSIKVEWYPISGGLIDNVKINKYKLHHRRRLQSEKWSTTEHDPQNEAFNVELRQLHPASKYEIYISAYGGKGKELRKSRHVCATTKSD